MQAYWYRFGSDSTAYFAHDMVKLACKGGLEFSLIKSLLRVFEDGYDWDVSYESDDAEYWKLEALKYVTCTD